MLRTSGRDGWAEAWAVDLAGDVEEVLAGDLAEAAVRNPGDQIFIAKGVSILITINA